MKWLSYYLYVFCNYSQLESGPLSDSRTLAQKEMNQNKHTDVLFLNI